MPVTLRVSPESPDAGAIREAAAWLAQGLVVAYPTDTLYGLAVDPRNVGAVRRLYGLKGRPETSALTLIAADVGQVRMAGQVTPEVERLAARWWPGPLTIVMRAGAAVVPDALAGGRTAGIRVPDHAVAVALARAAGFPITATSANRSGGLAATTAAAVVAALPDVDGVVDAGPVRGGAPSTIVDASQVPVTLIREGVVAWGKVLESLQ